MGLTLIGLIQLSTKATEFDEIMQNNGYYGVQGHSWSPIDFDTNQKPVYDFILVNNIYINLYPLSHCFQVIADYWSNFRFLQAVPLFNALIRVDPQIYEHEN